MQQLTLPMNQKSVIVGDCREVMATMPENSVDAVVTDPPYEYAFMNKSWDANGVSFDQKTWQMVLRVLKPGGHLLAFGAPRTYHRITVAIEDAGFEIRDCLSWLYGSGMPKGMNIGKAIDKKIATERQAIDPDRCWDGWNTTLKPAWEPIVLARKPLIGTVVENVTMHGTGAINVDGCRLDSIPPSVPQPMFNSPTGSIYGFKTGKGRSDKMSQSSGRWPPNVAVDLAAAAEIDAQAFNSSRFFYCAKASRSERNAGLDEMPDVAWRGNYGDGIQDNRPHTREGYEYHSTVKNHHPTVKPVALMRWLVRLVTPPKGTVLDPFTGSGSTGIACFAEGFRFVGIEADPDYAEIARLRIAHAEKFKGDDVE